MVCRLAVSLVDVSEMAPEPWVAMGYFSLNSKRFPRAVYFGQKVQMWTQVLLNLSANLSTSKVAVLLLLLLVGYVDRLSLDTGWTEILQCEVDYDQHHCMLHEIQYFMFLTLECLDKDSSSRVASE